MAQIRLRWRGIFCVAAFGLSVGQASAEDTLRTVHFQAGHSSKTIHDDLVERDSDIYSIVANADQTAEISIKSLETNANFVIYQPPSQITRSDDGLDIDGKMLLGGDAVPGLDKGATRRWKGALPSTGEYYVVVTSDRGNVTYDLTISIK
jgi:hypothetical protein